MQFECEKPKDETELIEKSICGMWRELLKCDDDDDDVWMRMRMIVLGLGQPDDGLRLALDWVKGRAPRRRPR